MALKVRRMIACAHLTLSEVIGRSSGGVGGALSAGVGVEEERESRWSAGPGRALERPWLPGGRWSESNTFTSGIC